MAPFVQVMRLPQRESNAALPTRKLGGRNFVWFQATKFLLSSMRKDLTADEPEGGQADRSGTIKFAWCDYFNAEAMWYCLHENYTAFRLISSCNILTSFSAVILHKYKEGILSIKKQFTGWFLDIVLSAT